MLAAIQRVPSPLDWQTAIAPRTGTDAGTIKKMLSGGPDVDQEPGIDRQQATLTLTADGAV
jgi:hypothetical protein